MPDTGFGQKKPPHKGGGVEVIHLWAESWPKRPGVSRAGNSPTSCRRHKAHQREEDVTEQSANHEEPHDHKSDGFVRERPKFFPKSFHNRNPPSVEIVSQKR